MAVFEGELKDVFSLAAAPEVVRGRFLDLDAIIAATPNPQKAEKLGDGAIHFVLQPEGAMGMQHTPDYTVRYRRDGDDVVWTTVSGNMKYEGRARFVASGSGTSLHYEGRIGLDLPVPRLMVRAIKPVAQKLIVPGMRAFVAKMTEGL